MAYYSYVLRSLKNGILYKGSTEDIDKRLKSHNTGMVNYTSKHMPWELVKSEKFDSRSEAMKREKWYKTGVGRDWIKKHLMAKLHRYIYIVRRNKNITIEFLLYL